MTIDLLCKVVDNYGDIGVVYRLAKALSELDEPPRLRLWVNDLSAFAMLDPAIDPKASRQQVHGWTILRWDSPWPSQFTEAATVVLECFACGRPDSLEATLFDPARSDKRLILNVEHLSAESWVDELHRMRSATRSGLVHKYLFMPGFTPNSGGLIMDQRFLADLRRWEAARSRASLFDERLKLARELGLRELEHIAGSRWIALFGYERDYSSIMEGLAHPNGAHPNGDSHRASDQPSGDSHRASTPSSLGDSHHAGGDCHHAIIAAAGKSQACLIDAWERAGKPCPLVALPFLPQESWDQILMASDCSMVRGEESLARAAIIGRPFLWHAYRQDEGHHQVKVQALADHIAAHIAVELGQELSETMRALNDRELDGPEAGPPLPFGRFLKRLPELVGPYSAFARSLRQNGNLAAKLMTFIRELV